MGRKALLSILSMCILLCWVASDAVWAEEGPSLVVHFDNGKTFLSAKDKSKLRALFRGYDVGPKSRVFILGYTDAKGDATGNYRLSRKRAQSVRREIISDFGIDATIVMAMGKGEENPVADNRKARGRALNRRAEIYLANAPVRKPVRTYGPHDPYLPTIQSLVQEAETLIKQQQYNDALRKLDKAGAMGGDHYSDWHAAYGITGYYAGAPNEEIKAHFAAAVRLDQYNFKAREFLSRIQARQKVAEGEVSEQMGQTAETAIAVTAVAQEYEYLRLFDVEPLMHRELENKPVDVWECLAADGAKVVYFFNHAGTYAWAFAQQARLTPTRPAPAASMKSTPVAPAIGTATMPDRKTGTPAADAVAPDPRKIWESRVFK